MARPIVQCIRNETLSFQILDDQIPIQEANRLPTFAAPDIGSIELKTEFLIFPIDHNYLILLPVNQNLRNSLARWSPAWINQTKTVYDLFLMFPYISIECVFRFRMFYVNVFSCAA